MVCRKIPLFSSMIVPNFFNVCWILLESLTDLLLVISSMVRQQVQCMLLLQRQRHINTHLAKRYRGFTNGATDSKTSKVNRNLGSRTKRHLFFWANLQITWVGPESQIQIYMPSNMPMSYVICVAICNCLWMSSTKHSAKDLK